MCDNAHGHVAVTGPPDDRGLSALRTLAQNGVAASDPRCQTLMTLLSANSAAPAPHDPHAEHPAPDPAAPLYADAPLQAQSSFVPRPGPGPAAVAAARPAPAPYLQWGALPPTHPELGVPYLHAPVPAPAQSVYAPAPGAQGAPPRAPPPPPPPQNVHASFARHLSPQPALPHAPNHAFSFEDTQHAILARRLAVEETVAAARFRPAFARPAQHSAPVDPAQHFVEMYSPRQAPRARPAPEPAAAAVAVAAAEERALRAAQEQQLRALDLLALHEGGGGGAPNRTAPRAPRAAAGSAAAGPRPPGVHADSSTRAALDFLLSADNVSPQVQAQAQKAPQMPNRSAAGAAIPAARGNKVDSLIPGLPTGQIDFVGDAIQPKDIKPFNPQQVSQADSVFHAAASAVEIVPAQGAAQPPAKNAAVGVKKPKKPRKPRSKDPKQPKQPKRPKKPKELKPKRVRKPKKSKSEVALGEEASAPTPVSEPVNGAAKEETGGTPMDVIPEAGSKPAVDSSAAPAPNADAKGKTKAKKRKRTSKKTGKSTATERPYPRPTGYVSEQVLAEGAADMDVKPQRNLTSATLSQMMSSVSGQGPQSSPSRHSNVKANGILPGQLPGNAVSQVTEKQPKARKKRGKKVAQASNPVMARLQTSLQQRIDGVPLEQVFQIKAQAEAYRRVSRGMEPPTEVTIASGGARSVAGNPLEGMIIPSDILKSGAYQADASNSARKAVVPDLPSQTQESDVSASKTGRSATPAFDALNEYRKQCLAVARARRSEGIAKREAEARELAFKRAEIQSKTFDSSASSANVSLDRSLATKGNHLSPVESTASNGVVIKKTGVGSETVTKAPARPKQYRRKPKKTLGLKKGGVLKANPAKAAALRKAAAPVTIAPPQYNGKTFRQLLFEREQRIGGRIQQRHAELDQLPPDIPEDVRRRSIIEKKQLNLLDLQRKTRASVTSIMHGLFTKGNSVLVGDTSLNRFRRPTPANWTWRNPSSSLRSNSGTLSAQAKKNVQKLEQKHRQEQEQRRRTRQHSLMTKLLTHTQGFRSSQGARLALHKKLMKDLDRFFANKARKEEQRRKKESHDRLRALRENNEDEYLALVKSTKNKRLLQLLKQTDQYLSQIGAQVERQKQAARREELNAEAKKKLEAAEAPAPSKEVKADEEEDDDDLQAMKQRRNEYYTVTHTVKEKVFQPKTLIGGTLKPYQLEGLEWLVSLYNNNLNGILADEMGLGKTIQTLSLITYLVEVKKVSGPYLVIVPLSTMSNWVRELERWAPSLKKVVYRGDPATRRGIQQREMAGGFNVLLSTYEFVVRDKNVLGKITWKYIIIDEGHRMKNSECKLALTLGSKYRSRNRVLLTGTPLQNNLGELWSLLNFLLPTIFSSSDTFETWFNAPFQAASLGGSAELNEEENLLVISRLHQVLRPFMLRRLKTDVECQLPEKVEEVFKCEMSVWQRVLYRQMRAKLGIAAGGSTNSTRSFNNMVMQLKKVCNHPYLFYNDEELASVPHDNLVRTSGKFELLNHALKKLKATGHRVLMFSQMTAALDYLEIFLMHAGIKCLRLDGTTKADDRQEMLENFNAPDSPYFCFLLSTRAGGLGLNLQTADTVIIFDSDWNPMMDLQAQDRAHRIGQTKEVRVIRLICSGSIEVKILERANKKLKMDAQVIQAGQFNNKSSDNDRQEMLKDILRNQGDDDDLYKSDISSLSSINRMLARTDEELDLFEEMDRERLERAARQGRPPLMIDESEIPAWVLQPEVEKKSKEQLEAEYIEQHGRGRRKRKAVIYEDNLTEKEWTEAIEEDVDIAEAISRKRRKKSQSQSEDDVHEEPEESTAETNSLKDPSPSPGAASNGPGGSARPSMDRESSSSAPTKLEPFVDPDLRKPTRPRRASGRGVGRRKGPGRPRKQR